MVGIPVGQGNLLKFHILFELSKENITDKIWVKIWMTLHDKVIDKNWVKTIWFDNRQVN